MRKIVYYVASSLDGFISAPNDVISDFVAEGSGAEQYLRDLQSFDTVIMGRNTYEFGYKYGMKPGQGSPLYAHMQHYIFSDTLRFESQDHNVKVKKVDLEALKRIKNTEGANIYLCGGGQFAGWLLDNGQIDVLKIKLNPLILGQGTPIFGNSKRKVQLALTDTGIFDKGLQILTYRIDYR